MNYYIIEPHNEGQEMNCHVTHKGSKASAVKHAQHMAEVLQNALPDCTITCLVRKKSKLHSLYADEDDQGTIVTPHGIHKGRVRTGHGWEATRYEILRKAAIPVEERIRKQRENVRTGQYDYPERV